MIQIIAQSWNIQDCTDLDLFSGALISSEEFCIALLSIFHKHDLTYSCITDLLKLFAYSLPSPNTLPPTQYALMKKFVDFDTSTIIHYCCGFCTRPLLSSGLKCSRQECQSASESSFIEVRLDRQIQCLFSGIIHCPSLCTVPLLEIPQHVHALCVCFMYNSKINVYDTHS